MEETKAFFRETQEGFTIYVVEQRFVVGRGSEYFKSYKGKNNYLSTDNEIKKNISSILKWIQKHTPNIGELIKSALQINSPLGIVEIISSLSKLFAVNEHQAAGPEVLDPIIIQEGEVSQNALAQLIALHKDSFLQPAIIILLKDNDFDRAKKLLCQCPHGINVKMIYNSGLTEFYKIINSGANDINSFIDAFSRQCFSTCSNTRRDVLVNREWAENSLVRLYSPSLFKVRTNLLFDEKERVKDEINHMISSLEGKTFGNNIRDEKLIQSLICISKLFRVYCSDYGGEDIYDAWDLAKDLKNEILLAHIFRYSFFIKNISMDQRHEMLLTAADIFRNNNIEDHAIYCTNNYLIQQMYKDKLNLRPYKELLEEAIYNVPGLVGMSYIYNNTGVAYIYSGRPEEAIELFEKGLNYARERIVPRFALLSNKLIAKEFAMQPINENEIMSLIDRLFYMMSIERLPFITSNIVANCLSIAYKHNTSLGNDIMQKYPVVKLFNNALTSDQMGSGSLCEQLSFISSKNSKFSTDTIKFPGKKSHLDGIRLNFIERYGLNPLIFHTWL